MAILKDKVDIYRSRLTALISEGSEDMARISYLNHIINSLEGKLSAAEKDQLFTQNLKALSSIVCHCVITYHQAPCYSNSQTAIIIKQMK